MTSSYTTNNLNQYTAIQKDANKNVSELIDSSEVADDETGLVYYNYRYYSAELGRWLSRDPIE